MRSDLKVSCFLIGHWFVNEVQTIAQIFFPHYKFEITDSHNGKIRLVTCINENTVSATVYVDEKTATLSQPTDDAKIVTSGLPPRRVLMVVLFLALQKVVPMCVPWGALTGIRPSKMVRTWLNEGKNDEDIIKILTEILHVQPDKAHLAVQVAHTENRLTEKIRSLSGTKKPPLGIYIGIPFCPTRCSYCSFNMAHKPPTEETLTLYINTLIHECREKQAEIHNQNVLVSSIYIGGGTPTVLPDGLLTLLLETVYRCFGTVYEYTVEAGRPDTLTAENLRIMRSYGVNRLAVNPQTLNDRTLQTIGRNHKAGDFFRAFEMARFAGFDNINVDMINGLPGESPDDLDKSLNRLLPLSPENITLHTLSMKRASRLNEERVGRLNVETGNKDKSNVDDTPDERINKSNVYATFTPDVTSRSAFILTDAGYLPYYLYRQKNTVGLLENTGYSKAGYECLYNIGMMSEVQTILGIGAGAVSKYVEGSKISRVFNEKNPEFYIKRRF
jgi:oxygen-independent coproporphyrinogen-3 oxidase